MTVNLVVVVVLHMFRAIIANFYICTVCLVGGYSPHGLTHTTHILIGSSGGRGDFAVTSSILFVGILIANKSDCGVQT